MSLIPDSIRQRLADWEARQLACATPAVRAEMEAFDRAFKNHKWRYIAGAVAFWLAAATVFRFSVTDASWREALTVTFLLFVCVGFAMLSAWFGHSKFRLSPRALGTVILLTLAGAICGALIGRFLKHGTIAGAIADIGSFGSRVFLSGLIAGVVYAMLLAGVVVLRRRMLEARNLELTREAERERTARQLADARLKLMQAQVEPHFLFNTLASVQELAEQGAPDAARLTGELIRFLRGGLASLRESTTTLAAEFRMIEAYLAIMKTRMGERLSYSLDLPVELADRAVPPAMLISLVENAIKHGLEPAPLGGAIVVRAGKHGEAGLSLVVSDSGRGLVDEPTDGGVGLSNIRERLEALYGSASRLTLVAGAAGGVVATIEIDDASA